MTVTNTGTDALFGPTDKWDAIKWHDVERQVKRLQMRIAKAVREGKPRKVQALQWLLTHSYYAKCKAVKRVQSNKGKNTPGVDGVIWTTQKQKMAAIHSLKRRGYKAAPLRRVYLRKKRSRKKRLLGIPTMHDRAMQALYALALAPIAETTGDPNSYGFREFRSCADAIDQCFKCLALLDSSQWVLDADIHACFDEISHDWILQNIPTDKRILREWLKAGYLDKGKLYPTLAGVPQGGIISPIIANMTLDGMEQAIFKAVPYRSKVNLIRYADDEVVTGKSEEILREYVVPTITAFLAERGLVLSAEKTRIRHIQDGFTFLGQKIRKHKHKLIIKPSEEAIRALLEKTKAIMRKYRGDKTYEMIKHLNSIIRGWCNYHRHVVSSKVFARIDHQIFNQLWKWARRRHPSKGKRWTRQNYWCSVGLRNWVFYGATTEKDGKAKSVYLYNASSTKIRRHVKIRSMANPYDAAYEKYFSQRSAKTGSARWSDRMLYSAT